MLRDLEAGRDRVTDLAGRARRRADYSLGQVGGHGLRPRVVKIVPVFDPAQIAGAMASRAGEQVHLMHFRNNLPALRAMLGTR